MPGHFRANLWLLVLTLLVCSAAYPLLLWAVGQAFFPESAHGSLVEAGGHVVGSRLIAQPFKGAEYFQPRPSAVAYNAAASGASNWGASNPLLRDRVARQLGTLVRYRDGREVGPDIERWFASQAPDFAARWAAEHPALAEQWVKDNAEPVAAWLKADGTAVKDEPGNYVKPFFKAFVRAYPATWPTVGEFPPSGSATRVIRPAREGDDVRAYLFESWRQANPDADLEPVPADLVLASGSGLDPHITLAGALYQLPRVARARAEQVGGDAATLQQAIEKLLRENARAPLGGLAGTELVNVLEINLELHRRYGSSVAAR